MTPFPAHAHFEVKEFAREIPFVFPDKFGFTTDNPFDLVNTVVERKRPPRFRRVREWLSNELYRASCWVEDLSRKAWPHD